MHNKLFKKIVKLVCKIMHSHKREKLLKMNICMYRKL